MTLDPDFRQDDGVGGAAALVALGPDVRQDDGVGGVAACESWAVVLRRAAQGRVRRRASGRGRDPPGSSRRCSSGRGAASGGRSRRSSGGPGGCGLRGS